MDFAKPEPEKGVGRVPSKIPPVSNILNPVNKASSKTIKDVESKIPKPDVSNAATSKETSISKRKPSIIPVKPINNSESKLSLGPTRNPRINKLASSRSCLNTQHSAKSREQTPRSQISEHLSDKIQKPADRVAAKKNMLAFDGMKDKLRNYQTEFLRKWEVVKSDLPPEEGEHKLIAWVKNNDGQLVIKNAQKFKIKCGQKTLEEFKKDMRDYVNNNFDLITDQLKNSSGKIGDNSLSDLECSNEDLKKKLKNDWFKALEDILKHIEGDESCNTPSEPAVNSELEVKVTKLLKEVDEYRKNLEQSQKELSMIKKSDEEKSTSYNKMLEEKDKKLNKKQLEYDELKKKLENLDKDILKDKTSNKELQEKVNNKTAEVEELKKKLKTSADSKQAQNKDQEARIKQLETDLSVALKDIENRSRIEHSIGDQTTKDADEIRILKENLVDAKKVKENLEKEIQYLKKEVDKHGKVSTQLSLLKDKAKHFETENNILSQTIKDLEDKLAASESRTSLGNNDYQEELKKLQSSTVENNQKIDVLTMELNKAHFSNQALKEKIAMDRKLLKVRCSLIESLQTKETTQSIHLQDLFAEVGKRNNDIQMLKSELLTKTEDFQNLFSTLSAKQLELTRQEHMIKLLQESNERAQTLRVKQEAKIGQLEEEISQLKETISLYQNAVLPNETLRRNLLFTEASHDGDQSDSLGYFIDERRRKRHIDINVKKYEK